jgi:ribosome-associated protein
MNDLDTNDFDADGLDYPGGKSKSQRKREMSALQELGRKLAELKQPRLSKFPLTEDLRSALRDYHRIKSNEAKRRQLQYIGKLMRNEDQESIEAVFDEFAAQGHRNAQQEQLAEKWRERLLEDENGAELTVFLDQHPNCDRQELRNQIRSAAHERQTGKPPQQAKKLFRLLREIMSGA